MFRHPTIVATVAMLAAAQPAFAQGAVVSSRQLSGDAANAIVVAAVEQCRKDGYKVAAAIVDRAGNLQAYLRDSGAGPQTFETSRRKAFTSAAFGITSAEFAARMANPASAGLKDVPGVIALAGGVAIKAGNEVIGGIGVGGAPGGDKDEACAAAGLAKIADQLK
ncbi:MAG: heme-binding protein [Rhodospirillales bacterium]